MNLGATRTKTVEINGALIAQLIEPFLYQLGEVKNSESVKIVLPEALRNGIKIEYTANKEVQTIILNG